MADGKRLICTSLDLVEGGAGIRFNVVHHETSEAAAFAVRHQGRVFAYYNRCGHVPVELDWNAGQFFDMHGLYLICSVHGALYDPQTGACLAGKCSGRGLQPLEVAERDGFVYLVQEGS